MKRILSLFLCLAIVSSFLFSVTSQAVTINMNGYTASQIVDKYPKAVKAIVKGVKNLKDSISVEKYSLDQTEVVELFKSIIAEKPEIFYVNPYSLKCSVSRTTGKVIFINPVYSFEKEEIPKKIKKFNSVANKYLSGVKKSWPDYKKCRYIHDMIINNCEYDVNYESYQSGNTNIRSAYGVFIDKIAVCQGYTLAYNYLLGKLGIEAHFVESYTLNHAWSMVKVGKHYYHVDVTWDDPTPDLIGRTLHSYFLISDRKLSALEPARKWISNMKATDTSYDNAWWSDVRTFIYTVNNKDYYIDQNYTSKNHGAFMCYNEKKGTHKRLYKIKSYWYENSRQINYWKGNYSHLVYYNKRFYFNTPKAVYSIKANGKNKKKCYSYQSKSWTLIYGLSLHNDGKVYAEIQGTPVSSDSTIKVIAGNKK